ncbi:Zinc finger, C3HC4 RING-type [Dillenia turbinata]|uniref:RING-type E3 ubiquitin transferase n=1 Tax=Dillenia turbinata TaxID=194707 RepID=A0AAN8VKS2_9MAGN
MATYTELPCDGDGICMACKKKPSTEETLTCKTCTTPWHLSCLAHPFENVANIDLQWSCPDCIDLPHSSSIATPPADPTISNASGGGLAFNIRAIQADQTLTEQEQDKRRQEVLAGEAMKTAPGDGGVKDIHDIYKGNLKCSICMSPFDRPVTTPCGHNFCLKCFQRWTREGNPSCANCRESIPGQMIKEPNINLALDFAIRMAKMSKAERTKRSGKANASSGRFFMTIPLDHFGPILAEHDPERNQGVLVGASWKSRHECKQWGVHFPQVAGIAGQSEHGAQSVVLYGEYDDDEDHGEWFLYTGRGGRDLSQNRTTKIQSYDQKFERVNEALRVSCLKGYPVRVVR